MILETLSDFFLFLSTDKKMITTQNLRDFDSFIESKFAYLDNKNSRFNTKNKEYTQLSYSLHSLLSELLYFNYKKKYIILQPEKESNILERINLKIQREKNNNTKEINEKKIKIEQTKVSLCSYLRNNEIDINLDPINFISFFNQTNERHRQTVVKFMKIIKPYLEEKARDLSQDNIKNKTADEFDRSKSDDKSNPNNKSGLSYVSEKESLIQNKEKFINVLNKVKININQNNENHHRKDIDDIIHNNEIKIEDINIKEIKKNNGDNSKNVQNSKSKNLVKDETKKKEDEIIKKGKVILTNENNNKNPNQITTTMNTNSNFDQNSETKSPRVNKDDNDCKCCSIF